MAGTISKTVLLWICINIILTLVGYNISADQGNVVEGFLGSDVTGIENSQLGNLTPTSLEVAQSDSNTAMYVDTVRTSFSFWSMIKNVVGGSFIALLLSLGLGSVYVYLIGVPLTIMFIFGIVFFIRGYDG